MAETDDSVIYRIAGVTSDTPLGEAFAARGTLFALSEATHDAALVPNDPGGLSRAERAALACRMAGLNRDEALAGHYASLLTAAAGDAALEHVCDPTFSADDLGDARLTAIVRHVDLVTVSPREASRASIEALRATGISEPDIVRLSELVAFVNYQLRVIHGLRLMRGGRS